VSRHAFFGLALLAQTAVLLAIPISRDGGSETDREIWLQVTADDRQDVMRGDYLQLRYAVSDPPHQEALGGFEAGGDVYVVLQEAGPDRWRILRVLVDPPTDLPADQVVLRGQILDGGLQIRAYLSESADGTWEADSVVTTRHPERIVQEEGRTLAHAWVSRRAVGFRDIESLFVPESQRAALQQDMIAHPDAVYARVRVSPSGDASVHGLRVGGRAYDF
jgi:uncharacterized membrane-anchored protein